MNKENQIKTKHPRFNNEFFGFKEIEEFFLNVLNEEKLSNAYIFYGVKGVGKATFAYRITRCILDQSEYKKNKSFSLSKNCKIYKNVSELSHPDLKVIEPDEVNEKIDSEKLQKLEKIVYSTSLESSYKIIIIDSLNDFTSRKSFSKLLKLLEDCPKNCIFFLISHSLFNIPDTIKSRCQKIYFKNISNNQLKSWFTNSNLVKTGNIDALLKLSNGSLGKAIEIINKSEYFDIYIEAEKIIKKLDYIEKKDIENFFAMYSNNLSIENFFLIIQINIIEHIKKLIEGDKSDFSIINKYTHLFFQINKKINNSKFYNLDSLQTLNIIKYYFIDHSNFPK